MLPLFFAEYVSAFPSTMSWEELYTDYAYNSSVPYTVVLKSRKHIHTYLDCLYNTVVLNNIIERRRIQDPAMLKSVIRFLFDNIGISAQANGLRTP